MSTPEEKLKKIVEFGDFQTPDHLAREVTDFIRSTGFRPSVVIEPTCGVGSFVKSSLASFESCPRVVGVEINKDHLGALESSLAAPEKARSELLSGDFFQMPWQNMIEDYAEPILFIGNPPWVTSAELGLLYSSNLPEKNNFQGRGGFDAISGKANFDISEWMLIHLLDWLGDRRGMVAMLCKTSVARKVLKHAWKHEFPIVSPSIHLIDAKKDFGVSVDACLFVCETGPEQGNKTCGVYPGISYDNQTSSIGVHDDELVADIRKYSEHSYLDGTEQVRWRSGVKHDCAKIMEFRKEGAHYVNGLGEAVELEATYMYPLYKSSDVAKPEDSPPRRWVLVTQTYVGQDTREIETDSPETWSYLVRHAEKLDGRRSTIYDKQPRFAVFGVGGYSFSPWKVAISGLYKKLYFKVLGPSGGKPPIVDDTCYSIPCSSESEARAIAELLNSRMAREFLESFVFWDAKRPINIDILRRLDLLKLAARSEKSLDLSGSLVYSGQKGSARQQQLPI